MTSRNGWVNYALLAALALAGAGAGLYLAGGFASPEPADAPRASPGPEQRFALTTEDGRDTVEAPSLAAGDDGRWFLTWASRTGPAERTVFFASTPQAGQPFDAPRAIRKGGIYKTAAHGKSGGHERRATPHVLADGRTVYLSWSEALPDAAGMRMVLATSHDGGATFDSPHPVHSGAGAKPTFTSMTLRRNRSLACAWLDDRSGFQQPYAAIEKPRTSKFQAEKLVHAGEPGVGICPCCPTSLAFDNNDSLYVAFRNIHDGYRDISIGRLRPGEEAFVVGNPLMRDTWKFDGCPHDGPSLAISGDFIHVAWMDAHSGSPRCYYGRARLDQMVFETRELHPIASGSQGNASLWTDSEGNVHAVWEESLGPVPEGAGHAHGAPKLEAGASRTVMYAMLPAGAKEFGPACAVNPKPGAFQTRPTVGKGGGELVFAWNELDTANKKKAIVVTRFTPELLAGGQP